MAITNNLEKPRRSDRVDTFIYNLAPVILPQEEVGTCKNWKRCRNFKVILGNGYCVDCYDKGLDNRRPPK